jgi:signal transduction histidine kinase
VLVNLLRNAIEAGATQSSLRLDSGDGPDALVVTDNGPGLPYKVASNLFRPFNGAGRNGGTGLGLVIARDLLRAHGGDLTLRYTGPEGTAFDLRLSEGLAEDLPAQGSDGDSAVYSQSPAPSPQLRQ